jgi:large conductance mechanosensitive channel
MKIISEFKEFAMKGSIIDLGIAVIIGGAFGKIISSFVSDVLMPPIGLLLGGVNFTDIKLVLKNGTTDLAGKVINPVTLNIGNFIQVSIDFLIIAFALFILIKAMNTFKKKQEAVPEITATEALLTEIRDLLKTKE